MAIPISVVFALLTRASVSILTRPTAWLVLFGWIAISHFDFGTAANEAWRSLADLWWLVVLILLTTICNTAIKAHLETRHQGDR